MELTSGREIDSLLDIFVRHEGYLSDKWMQYFTIYQREISALLLENRPLKLLEIGIQNGGSLAVWEKFLPENSEIYGIDIDPKCANLAFGKNIHVIIADSGNEDALKNAIKGNTFDIIIDDGSHLQSDIISAFAFLFPKLNPGGLYFIEDLHCSYWESHEGGFRKNGSAVEELKNYVDAIHIDYCNYDTKICDDERELLKSLNADIARITFIDSVAVVEKYPQPKIAPFLRVIAGNEMHVTHSEGLANAIAHQRHGFVFSHSALQSLESPVVLAMEGILTATRSELVQRCIELGTAAAQNAAAAAHINELSNAISNLQTEVQNKRAEIAAATASIAEQAAILTAVRIELTDALTTGAAAHSISDDIRAELAAATAERDNEQRMTHALRTELAQALSAHDHTKTLLEQVRLEAQQAAHTWAQQLDVASTERDNGQALIEELRAELAGVLIDRDHAKTQLEQTRQDARQAADKWLRQHNNLIAELQNMAGNLKWRLSVPFRKPFASLVAPAKDSSSENDGPTT